LVLSKNGCLSPCSRFACLDPGSASPSFFLTNREFSHPRGKPFFEPVIQGIPFPSAGNLSFFFPFFFERDYFFFSLPTLSPGDALEIPWEEVRPSSIRFVQVSLPPLSSASASRGFFLQTIPPVDKERGDRTLLFSGLGSSSSFFFSLK